MKFNKLPLDGAFTIDLQKYEDDRGFFARYYCRKEFEEESLDTNIVQVNNSLSRYKGTLRGIHYQLPPKAEVKIVRCIKGSLFDVILDLRSESETFGHWFGEVLSAENRRMMYVPKGFGHAFLTLEDDTETLYMVTEFYSPDHERGLRYNDPEFQIKWPFDPVVISDKDKNIPDFDPEYHLQ